MRKTDLSPASRCIFDNTLQEIEKMAEANFVWLAVGKPDEGKRLCELKPRVWRSDLMLEDSVSEDCNGWEDSPENN